MIPDNRVPFPSVIGQIESRQLIMRIVLSGRLTHSYLFIGPEGSGRRALAIELARVLNCPEGVEKAVYGCSCHSCTTMLKWRHPNLMTIFPLPKIEREKKNPYEASDAALEVFRSQLETSPYTPLTFAGTGQILVDHIREVRDKVSFAPDDNRVRVLIIHPADALREEAANAFLKLLEEPPEKCLLILTAESRRNVLPTILSRCQQIHLAPLSQQVIARELSSTRGLDQDRSTIIAALANGSYTRALELLESQTDRITLEGLDFLRAAAVGNVQNISEIVEKWVGEDTTRSGIKDRLDIASLWILDAISVLASRTENQSPTLRLPDRSGSVGKMAERYGAETLLAVMKELEEAKLTIDANVIQSLALTTLAIKLRRVFQNDIR